MRAEDGRGYLRFVDDLVADGVSSFTFADAVERLQRSPPATANVLRRLTSKGLIECVRRGHYVVRPLGLLGTSAASEELPLAVGAAFADRPHRIAYRSALDEHSLLTQPVRSIQVALTGRTRTRRISNRRLQPVIESAEAIDVGATPQGSSRMSDLERALLDGAARPDLVSAGTLAEALVMAGGRVKPATLTDYARRLSWGAALRRIGSIADALEVPGLGQELEPLTPLTGDIDLEPGQAGPTAWRDPRWRVRWGVTRDELASVARQ